MKHIATAAVVLLLPLLLAACGDDDEGDDDSAKEEGSTTESLSPDEAAIKETLVESLLDPRCDLLTDDYLLELSLFGAESVEEACDERLEFWQEPQYDEEDILVSDIVVTGDTATAVIGSEYTNLTTTYELKLVDGSWKVNCDDFSCDHLDEASAEVS